MRVLPGAAVESFVRVFGHPPTGVWAAPGRVNLIGEHTDYNDGYVLPFALPQRTLVAAAPARAGWTVWSEQTGQAVSFGARDLTPGAVTGWAAYVAGVVWSLREHGYAVPGARITVASDVPTGAGLSSSAALECAVLAALADLGGLGPAALPRSRWPGLAQRAEHGYVGMPCGIMDQSAAVLCQAGHALFLDCRSGDWEHVPLDLAGAGLAVLVVDTRAPHRLVSGEYAERRRACERAAAMLGVPALRDLLPAGHWSTALDGQLLRRTRHVVTENQRVLETVTLLRAGRVREIGPLLSASHASLRDDFQVTVPELDIAAATATASGALGARMTGGGFGGCVIALVEAGAVDRVGAAVADAFATRGFASPAWFTAAPSPGATRLS